MKIDIVIPVFNEGENIGDNLLELERHLIGLPDTYRVLVVYDFENDDTIPAVKEIREKYSVPIVLVRNSGRGAADAIREGFRTSTADFVLVSMADRSDDYRVIGPMANRAREGSDLVCASRYMKGGRLHGGPLVKQLLSRLAGISLHHLTGLPTHDATNSFKLYRKTMVEALSPVSMGGFEISLELCAKAHRSGYRITELPAHWWDRDKGKSKFKLFRWLPHYLFWYFAILFAPAAAVRRTPILFAAAFSLLFSLATTANMAYSVYPVGELLWDSQLAVNAAYNFAHGRGFRNTITGNGYSELVTPDEMRVLVANDPGPYIPNNWRSPGPTVILGTFLWLAGYDLIGANLLLNFTGLWLTGFLLSLFMYSLFRNRIACILPLAIHFAILTQGWTSTYPPLLVINLFLLATLFFACRWLEGRRSLDAFLSGLALAFCIASRFQWVLFLPSLILALFLMSGRRMPLRSALLLFAPTIIICGSWMLHNKILLGTWEFEQRGHQNLISRVYPDGWGRYAAFINPKPDSFPAMLESIIGPIPEKVKNEAVYSTNLEVHGATEQWYEIPEVLKKYTLLASAKIILDNPINYLRSGMIRATQMFTTNLETIHTPRKTFCLHPKVQRFLENTRLSSLFVLLFYPLAWYAPIFVVISAILIGGILAGKRVPAVFTLSILAVFYNVWVVSFIGNRVGYLNMCFSLMVLMIAAALYWMGNAACEASTRSRDSRRKNRQEEAAAISDSPNRN